MSQYGMNGYNPMVYNQQPQNAYNFNNTPYVSGINWAQGIEGAKAFRIKPNDMEFTNEICIKFEIIVFLLIQYLKDNYIK